MAVTFIPGSEDGDSMCVTVPVISDSLVEYEEDFIVTLELVTSGVNLNLGNTITTVTIMDSNGIHLNS